MVEIIIVLGFLGIMFGILLLIRNNSVYKEQMKMHTLIFEKKDGHFKHSLETTIMLVEEMNLFMNYDTMVWKFWIPVSDFKYHSNTLIDFKIENKELARKLYAKELKQMSKPKNLKKLLKQASKLVRED